MKNSQDFGVKSVFNHFTYSCLFFLLMVMHTSNSHAELEQKNLFTNKGNPNFKINKYSIDSGGGDSVNSNYLLRGTIGQSDTNTLQGEGFILRSGFWSGSEAVLSDLIFFDGFDNQ